MAQSPQFYKQFEIAGGRERVFSIGPVFRAENSNTPRHMTEFTGLDMEMEIKNSYQEVLQTLEGVLLSIFRGIQGQFCCLRRWLALGLIKAYYRTMCERN